jgi:glycosyltransferase involved in cell wall biosynthesis
MDENSRNKSATVKRVLIAHQSAIPHYRVPFYQSVNRLRPDWWNFEVVFDNRPGRRGGVFIEPPEAIDFGFPTVPTRTYSKKVFGKTVLYQSFVRRVRSYDLIVLEDALHNLAYPLARAARRRGTAIAYWGHGRDRSIENMPRWKKTFELLKRRWILRSDGYFAYTPGVRDDLLTVGLDRQKIHVLNNTIDILAERGVHERIRGMRELLRQDRGLADRRVVLFVGRLMPHKRIGFLARAMAELRAISAAYHLVVIGGGDDTLVDELRNKLGNEGMTYCGVIVDRERLAEWFVASDVYATPGDVGLGVVQSLCYDLTPITIDRPTHNPEYEYLDNRNAVIAPRGSGPIEYARAVHKLCSDSSSWSQLRHHAWPSICHLTIDSMARRFLQGVKVILT